MSKKKRVPSKTGRQDPDEPAQRRETKPFNARKFMTGEPEGPPAHGGYLVDDAVGEEAERVRPSGPRSAAASRILGAEQEGDHGSS